jgi:hypothetical protein
MVASWAIRQWAVPEISSVLLMLVVLLLVFPLVFAPLWFVARSAGFRGWVGAAAAGAATFVACGAAIDFSARSYLGLASALPLDVYLSAAVVGATAGFVVWRVSHWDGLQS